ncbi:MAG: methyltransferase regulatory domain-containing protein, partial [Betaproteobacteria bacterium]
VRRLHETGARYFDAHPRLAAWLERLQRQDRAYLAHEYFNRDWHPATSDEVAQAMAGAGLEFAASTDLAEEAEATGFGSAARDFIESIAQPDLREAVLDLVAHRSFRSDIFVRNGHPHAAGTPYENLARWRFVLLQHPDHLPGSVQIGRTRYALPAEVYHPFAIAMAAQDYAPKSLRDLAAHPECRHLSGAQLAQAALVLTDAGCLHPTQPPADRALAARRCAGLNALILKRAATATEITALASPLLGAGVAVAREEMLFLRARMQGLQDHDEWACHAWESMGAGDPAVLGSAARAFASIRLPVLQAVGVA